jgi:hypothetical protein
MLLPVLLIGVVAFLAGRVMAPSSPVVGALPAGSPACGASRAGETVRFELGRPYRVVVTTELPQALLQKLCTWLRLGTYHARDISIRQRPVPPGARCLPSSELTLTFNAPKTESVPLGKRVIWDLGDGKATVTLRRVDCLDGAPLTVGAAASSRIKQLRAQARAELAMARALGRPIGPIMSRLTDDGMDLERRGHARPSELPRLFDELLAEHIPDELAER